MQPAKKTRGLARGSRRFGMDFAVGLALFAALSLGIGAYTSGASRAAGVLAPPVSFTTGATSSHGIGAFGAIEKAAFLSRDQSVARLSDAASGPWTTILLALTFATLLAFNLAIARHLRRVHASPRRRSWWRG